MVVVNLMILKNGHLPEYNCVVTFIIAFV